MFKQFITYTTTPFRDFKKFQKISSSLFSQKTTKQINFFTNSNNNRSSNNINTIVVQTFNNNNFINNTKRYSTINNKDNKEKDKEQNKMSTTSSISSTTTSTTTDKDNLITGTNELNKDNKTLFDKFIKNKYEYPRFSKQWWIEKGYIFTIFGITGTSSLYVVKFILKHLFGYENPASMVSLITGSVPFDPKYFAIYFMTMYTFYPFVLLSYGTLFARYQYFVKFFNRMSVFSQLKRLFIKATKSLKSPPKKRD